MSLHPLRNPVREYAWGSRDVIPELLGEPTPSATPQAELWMGAHGRASSAVLLAGAWRPLRELLAERPEELLGAQTLARFGPELPFLFKILAVERPLSLQVHPDAERARRGFARESAAALPLGAPQRSYADPLGKLELVCALSPFHALCGFRPLAAQQRLCAPLGVPTLDRSLETARAAGAPAGRVLTALLRLSASERAALAHAAAAAAARLAAADPAYALVAALAESHPGDVAALAPLLLESVELRPGQALFLAPGQLHSYQRGTALELMVSSDNVVRGGLTTKHVDVAELLAVTDLEARAPLLLEPAPPCGGERIYPAPTDAFRLSVLDVAGELPLARRAGGPPEILLCLEGELRIREESAGSELQLRRGESAFVAANTARCRLAGRARLYRATLPEAAAT